VWVGVFGEALDWLVMCCGMGVVCLCSVGGVLFWGLCWDVVLGVFWVVFVGCVGGVRFGGG